VVIEAKQQAEAGVRPEVRIGFTATKRVGNAVIRNRAKRRLRAAAQALIPTLAQPGCDYVFIAREATPSAPWPRLLDDVRSALLRLAPSLSPAAEADSGPRPELNSDQNGHT
jgi:ribonuclease P protein component